MSKPSSESPQLWRPRVLREYAFIADGERGALIDPDGAIVWLCAPTWDSQPVLSGLLGGRSGYQVSPADPWRVWGGYYEPGGLIWRSRWVGAEVIECREALALPSDEHRLVLLRRIEAVEGQASVDLTLDLEAGEQKRTGDSWAGRVGDLYFRWSGAPEVSPDREGRLTGRVTVAPGQHLDLVLEISDRSIDDTRSDPDALWTATVQAWAAQDADCSDLIASRDARHAHAVLTGLTAHSGAMVAAATTSLPERLGGLRNYDYRYAWIRDQCYAGMAMAAHGKRSKLAASVGFITERLLADGPDLSPAYTVTGGRLPPERDLPLSGYPGSDPRVGNRVRNQFQLDCFGEVLELLAAAAPLDVLSADDWRAAELAAKAIEEHWRRPEAGIWELDDQLWTHSRLACVSGLRAISGVARHDKALAARWASLADSLLASLDDSVHPSGRWQRSPSDDRVDAALLLSFIRGGVPVDDPRSKATMAAVERDLTDDGFVYRFKDGHSRAGRAEGAFLLCGFWMALAARLRGNDVEAANWFERSRSACGPAALYTEEYDTGQRQQRGNLPQAFVHAAMLECAVRLSD